MANEEKQPAAPNQDMSDIDGLSLSNRRFRLPPLKIMLIGACVVIIIGLTLYSRFTVNRNRSDWNVIHFQESTNAPAAAPLPVGFPKDFPIITGATLIQGTVDTRTKGLNHYVITWSTDQSQPKTIVYYVEELTRLNWFTERTITGADTIVEFSYLDDAGFHPGTLKIWPYGSGAAFTVDLIMLAP